MATNLFVRSVWFINNSSPPVHDVLSVLDGYATKKDSIPFKKTPETAATKIVEAATSIAVTETLYDAASNASGSPAVQTKLAQAENALQSLVSLSEAIATPATTTAEESGSMITPAAAEPMATRYANVEEELYSLYDAETVNSAIETWIARAEVGLSQIEQSIAVLPPAPSVTTTAAEATSATPTTATTTKTKKSKTTQTKTTKTKTTKTKNTTTTSSSTSTETIAGVEDIPASIGSEIQRATLTCEHASTPTPVAAEAIESRIAVIEKQSSTPQAVAAVSTDAAVDTQIPGNYGVTAAPAFVLPTAVPPNLEALNPLSFIEDTATPTVPGWYYSLSYATATANPTLLPDDNEVPCESEENRCPECVTAALDVVDNCHYVMRTQMQDDMQGDDGYCVEEFEEEEGWECVEDEQGDVGGVFDGSFDYGGYEKREDELKKEAPPQIFYEAPPATRHEADVDFEESLFKMLRIPQIPKWLQHLAPPAKKVAATRDFGFLKWRACMFDECDGLFDLKSGSIPGNLIGVANASRPSTPET
ncbi:hypothetical protein HDV00_000326 [Rhizophlyctis rosea]|nr:hypothetical protein HDV00_000326 [Rhizophlyctis rosea]